MSRCHSRLNGPIRPGLLLWLAVGCSLGDPAVCDGGFALGRDGGDIGLLSAAVGVLEDVPGSVLEGRLEDVRDGAVDCLGVWDIGGGATCSAVEFP